jgi:hypothetical protein
MTAIILEALNPITGGLPGRGPTIWGANTSSSLNDVISSGSIAAYVGTAQSMPFDASPMKINDVLFLNYLVSDSSLGTSGFFLVTSTGGGSLTAYPSLGIGTLQSFVVTVSHTDLASGGIKVLFPSTGTQRYRVWDLKINSGGTNFSGGGGDRLGQITDDTTTVYSVIPAASLQTLANAQWGVTALPNPASQPISTPTVAGASLNFQYSGGTTDYTAGSIVVAGLVERVA